MRRRGWWGIGRAHAGEKSGQDAAGGGGGEDSAENSQRGPGESVQDHQAQHVGAACAESDTDADFVNSLRDRVHEQREDSGHGEGQGAAGEERRAG